MTPPVSEFAAGTVFADHVIHAVARRSGSSVVYRAMHLPLRRDVALEVFAPPVVDAPDRYEGSRRAFELAASLEHPRVLPVFHVGEHDGLFYVTTRSVREPSLWGRLTSGRVPVWDAVRIVEEIADALDAVHARGVVHGNVQPANILIEDGHALLAGFELARDVDASRGDIEALIGSFDYAAPEQLDVTELIDRHADIYALGCVLFHALTGRVPFPRESLAAQMFAHLDAPPPSVRGLFPDIPLDLDEVVKRAMAKAPEQRFQTAGEFGEHLRRATGGYSSTTASTTIVSPRERPRLADLKLSRPRARDLTPPAELLVFLCHSSGDKAAVRHWDQRLRADGMATWLDETALLPGQDWDREIRAAVRRADIVIVFLSGDSLGKRGYVQKEIRHVLDVAEEQPADAIFLIPARLDACDVPERLNRWHWVDLHEQQGYERLLASLLLAKDRQQ